LRNLGTFPIQEDRYDDALNLLDPAVETPRRRDLGAGAPVSAIKGC